MLVSVLPIPPVTMTSPSGRIEAPGQNMSCAVLLTVELLTAPVARLRIAVCVYCSSLVPSKLSSASADHTTSLSPGISATATGTSGNPIVGPHWPTTDGLVEPLAILTPLWSRAGGDCPCGAPASTSREMSIARSADEDTDSAVSRTARTSCATQPTRFRFRFACHVPYATGAPKWLPSLDSRTTKRPITPRIPCGRYVSPETIVGFANVTVTDWGRRTRPPRRPLCQNDDWPDPSTAPAECPDAVLDALTVQSCGSSAGAYGMNAAAVGISMCIIEPPVDPELPVAPELPIIAPELPIAIERARPDPRLPAAAALPDTTNTSTTDTSNR